MVEGAGGGWGGEGRVTAPPNLIPNQIKSTQSWQSSQLNVGVTASLNLRPLGPNPNKFLPGLFK